MGHAAPELGRREDGRLRAGPPGRRRRRQLRRRRWATSTGRSSPSITRWPTRSPSATPTTARCSGRPTPTASWRCRAPSTPPARAAVRSSSRRPAAGRSSTGSSRWTTMPEQLLDAGVTWKVYNDPTGLALFSPLPYFKAYNDPTTTRGLQLQQQALAPNYPGRLRRRRGGRDAAAGELDPRPRHPVRAPRHGAAVGREPGADRARHADLEPRDLGPHALHPPLRRERRLLRPRAPAGAAAGHAGRVPHRQPAAGDGGGIAGPVGLGFRVPCLLMSPFTQGGYMATEVFDHTSTLLLLEKLFGVPVPNVSALAPRHRRRHDERAGARPAGATRAADAARRLARRCRWSTRRSSSTRSTGTFDEGFAYPPPTAERHARPGDHAAPARAAR